MREARSAFRVGLWKGSKGDESFLATLLGCDLLCDVDIEEIKIKPSLNNSRRHGDWVNDVLCEISERQQRRVSFKDGMNVEVYWKGCVPIYPVGDIQSSISAQRGEVMRSDSLRFARSLKHEQLWENGDCFQEDGE